MNFTRRTLGKAAIGLAATFLVQVPAMAQDRPAPFDKPGDVKIALVRYLSTGDFFQAYLSGVECAGQGARRRPARAGQPPGRGSPGRHGRPGDRARRAGHHHPARADRIDEGSRAARGRRRHQGRRLRRQRRERQDPADRAVGPRSGAPRARTGDQGQWRELEGRLCLCRRHRAARPPQRNLGRIQEEVFGHQRSRDVRHAGQPDRQLGRQPGALGADGEPRHHRDVRAL